MSLRIVFIGAGNVASHLAPALEAYGAGEVAQVYSRSLDSAADLAAKLRNASAVNAVPEVITDADVYIVSLVDDAIAPFVAAFPKGGNALWLHTSGSVGMEVLAPLSDRYGVFYPLQTFSRGVEIDVSRVPLFIEGCNETVEAEIRRLGEPVFADVYHADSDTRRMMHISAVFACNFTNHIYALAVKLLQKQDIPADVLLPLIDETAAKIHTMPPREAQTGPAIRYDENVINKHLAMLGDPDMRSIYRLISQSIHKEAQHE